MDVSMGDVLKKNAKNRTERDQALQELMTQLFESMDKLQENMQKIAVRIEKAPVGQEGTMDYDPPQPPGVFSIWSIPHIPHPRGQYCGSRQQSMILLLSTCCSLPSPPSLGYGKGLAEESASSG